MLSNTSTIAKTTNGVMVFVPAELHDLTARRLELDMMDDYDPETYPALWETLADDYEAIYPGGINAQKCREKAQYYRAKGAF